MEFQNQSEAELTRMVTEIRRVLGNAGFDYVPGICPPGWNAPPALLNALLNNGIEFLASARDTETPIRPGARTAMSGVRGVSLLEPSWLADGRLAHLPSNFDATTPLSRAHEIVNSGGVVGIKVHVVKQIGTYVARDGLDRNYRNYLDAVLGDLEDHYGDELWWTSMAEVSDRLRQVRQERSA